MSTSSQTPRHIALQFGHVRHFNEGLAEFSRQLATQFAAQAKPLSTERNWHFHFILPKRWHGLFGDEVEYHELTQNMRLRHRFPVDLDIWHGMHQHMRYRPPCNSARNLITVHDLNHVYSKKGLRLWWQNLRLKRQLGRADQLVAISAFAARDLTVHLPGLPPSAVIHNGVANLTFVEQTPIAELAHQDFLLHLSRMSSSKNVESLIRLAAIAPDFTFALVGPDSAEVARHRQEVARLQLHNVLFKTNVTESEKAWLYQHCSAFLFPSLQEGFGLPPVEAMYFGCPVFASNLTSLPEVCGEAAFYFDDFSAHAMRERLLQGLATFQRYPASAQRVKAHAHQYDWARSAQQYLLTYERMMMP